MTLIDFEVGHFGDPGFDVGFFLTHLVLKGIHRVIRPATMVSAIGDFLATYFGRMKVFLSAEELDQLETQGFQHLAGCLVARVHGKSPVDYLTPPEQLQAVALAEKLFGLGPAATWQEAYELLQAEFAPS